MTSMTISGCNDLQTPLPHRQNVIPCESLRDFSIPEPGTAAALVGSELCRRGRGICRSEEPEMVTLGTIQWKDNQDWYGDILQPFASSILDKKTCVCYDPIRAFNSLPDGFEIKPSTIPGAGLGAYTNIYMEQDTIFGPYKGTFDPDTASAEVSGYSWKIDTRNGEDRADVVWVDAKDVALSNWLRYVNTPNTAVMENTVAFQYKGEMYYQAFKSIQPGTELFVWYGDAYGEFLEIEKFESPRYYYANYGYVGGTCGEDEEGQPCRHSKNSLCADKTCFCIPDAHLRAGLCILDETVGGECVGSDGETCKADRNAECLRGVCVYETFGGRCSGKNGQSCFLDDKSECVNGLCRCRYGTSGIGGKCITDETLEGRCIGDDGEVCELDDNAECWDSICICKKNASAINGKCELDETLGGKCQSEDGITCQMDTQTICKKGICVCKKETSNVGGICVSNGSLKGECIDGNCLEQNVVCDATSNTCVCQSNHHLDSGKCVKE